ncbi:MAG: DUF5063 domain-containing protein [Planctomycetota bacterium]|nr:DUF5063 domain-containing protein [Planctomycetota bacterium]
MSETSDEVIEKINAFRDEGETFCALVDEIRQGTPQDLYARLMRSMTRLACRAEELPPDLAWGDGDENGPRMTAEEWDALYRQVGVVVGREVSGLSSVFGGLGLENDAAQALRLADDLADVYRDLLEGLVICRPGTADVLRRAACRWRLNYEIHWGEHLFNALHTVCQIRYYNHVA